MSNVIGITGVTGNIGRRVRTNLEAAGQQPVLLTRTPSKVIDAGPDQQVRACDYSDPTGAQESLRGITTLFMVSGPEAPDRVAQHTGFIDAASAAGVQHIVYTSFQSAAPDATFTLARDHYFTEEHLKASGIAYTFLRDSLYADFLPMMTVDGAIRGPAGDGTLGAVAQDDVAASAAAVLAQPEPHVNVTYNLTGPQAYRLSEIAAIVSEVTGTPVTYEPETIEEAYASRAVYDAPQWQLDAWVSTYAAIADGSLALVTGDVEQITGQPATSLPDLLRRNAVHD